MFCKFEINSNLALSNLKKIKMKKILSVIALATFMIASGSISAQKLKGKTVTPVASSTPAVVETEPYLIFKGTVTDDMFTGKEVMFNLKGCKSMQEAREIGNKLKSKDANITTTSVTTPDKGAVYYLVAEVNTTKDKKYWAQKWIDIGVTYAIVNGERVELSEVVAGNK